MGYALFLDFDGTLVDIAPTPDAVRVEPGLPATLARLRECLGCALAIVSGRSIAVLDGFLTPETFDAAGLHGLERRLSGTVYPCRPEHHPALREWVAHLRSHARAGLLIEDKGCSVALHWRTAPHLADEAADLVAEAARKLGSDYRVQEGKSVLEIVPASAGKGQAIRWFMDSAPYSARRPIFVGDDRTDENGFVAVQSLGGLGIKIGQGGTAAKWRVRSVDDLRRLLHQWAQREIDPSALSPS